MKSVDENEILNIVKNLKSKKSTDNTDIDMILIKNIIHNIVEPFTHICNQSFLKGIFPNKMKTAKVIPIYKAGDRHQFTNYRPISLLSQFSKILEKLFVARLDNFIEKYQLLSEHQYGFRSNRSTLMAVTELVESISTGMNNREYTVGVFIDLKKAFDTIDHKILLKKMDRYGVRGVANMWLESYLQERNQYVQINNVDSDPLNITHGVPQGSVLGPKLFIMYINDIGQVLTELKYVLFADDTSLYKSGKDLEQLLHVVEKELLILKKWFDINKLSLNLSKTKYILFCNKKIDKPVKLKIQNVEIEQVNEHKFLGIIIDNKLCWKPHIVNIKSKLSKTVAILYKLKQIVNKNSLHLLYCSLMVPYLTYCVEVWGSTYKTIINPIYMLQKKAIRIISKSEYLAPTNTLFIKEQILKLEDLVNLNIAKIMFKAHHNNLPPCMQRLFKARETQYQLRGTHIFEGVTARINTKDRCLSVRGVRLWNSLDNELKTCKSITKFKNMYKNRMINKYRAIRD